MTQHGHQRHDAGAASEEQRRCRPLPHEPATDRPADVELVARLHDVVEEHRHLTALETFDRELELVAVLRSRSHGVGALCGVPVGRSQPHDDVLACALTKRRVEP